MIISRTPFRISLFGGGTDYPAWFKEHGGAVIGGTIDKYCYISVRHLPPYFPHKSRIVYASEEWVNYHRDIKHPSVRECLRHLGVKDGVEMAKKNRLPNEIIDIINQHHGTTLMTYFYSRALKEDPNSTVLEAQFRYHCEKPKSREAALIMLADAVEATARTLEKPTLNRVEHMVKKLIKDRLVDGQLDESDLTLAQLETTAKVFAQTLTTMYHTRIEYPEIEPTSKKDKEALIGRPGGKSIRRSNKAIGS